MLSLRRAATLPARRLSTTTKREYDLVLFGATGYSGRMCADYLLRTHKGLRVALAGRDRAKLEKVAEACATTPRIVVADAQDADALQRLAASTEVVASTAGPFRKYGSLLVEACAQEGTSYADITGESGWTLNMAAQHHETCVKTGAVIVPQAGFDSVPSDIGTMLAVKHHSQKHGAPPSEIRTYVTSMRGARFQGGTVDTLAHELAEPIRPVKPSSIRSATKTKIDWTHGTRPWQTVSLKGKKRYLSPFIMAGANCPIVRRSNGLLSYKDGLVYSEAMALPSLKFAVQNFAVLGIGTSLLKMGMLDFLRKRGMVPETGAGPTLKQARRASYEYVIVATGDDGSRSETTWSGNGDPSAIATTIFLVETALGLLAKRGSEGGVLTPAVALGDGLWARLEKAKWDAADEAPAVTVEHN